MDKPGFCAIGSGQWAAETILFSLGQSIDNGLEETIYKVCAAKFIPHGRRWRSHRKLENIFGGRKLLVFSAFHIFDNSWFL